jgi:hypothetical protein
MSDRRPKREMPLQAFLVAVLAMCAASAVAQQANPAGL